jgi:cytochrome c biogenesis protein CcmG, thiol:disulfide interchange protein DsbE
VLSSVASAVVLVSALFADALTRDPTVVKSALLDRPAPDFVLRTMDGGRLVRLSDLRGQVVVINFWASWCAECRIEHDALEAAWQRYRDQGVVLIGIPFQDRPSASRAYLRELGGDWPILADPGDRVALRFGVYGVPETFFIDRQGRIAAKHVSAVSYEMLTDTIARLLPGGRA